MTYFYVSTEDIEEDVRDQFYEQMEQVTDKLPNYEMKIVLGDANPKIGNWCGEVVGKKACIMKPREMDLDSVVW